MCLRPSVCRSRCDSAAHETLPLEVTACVRELPVKVDRRPPVQQVIGRCFFLGSVVALAALGCAYSPRGDQNQAPAPSLGGTQAPTMDLIGGWVFNDAWAGFMGVAIKFDAQGTFRYWFYSDVRGGGECSYPITGSWRWKGNVLELTAPCLHEFRWHPYLYHDELCLLPEYAWRWQARDGKVHADRLLFKIADFDEHQPFARTRGQ